ncbi:MAG: ammonium transporter [Cyanobacteria bacterium J06560_2]
MSVNGFDAVATLWLMTAAALVFFMNAGFAMLETGFCRTGNAVNVLAKNLIVFCIATAAFWLFGFRFMLGDSASTLLGPMVFAVDFPFPTAAVPNPFPDGFETLRSSWAGRSFAALFFFQLVFAGTAATIVSGAVAERIKFWGFILFSFVLVAFIYPLVGYWVWGSGWLASETIQFRDFAGSTVVHSVGGVSALVGAWVLQPRQGRFGYDVASNGFTRLEKPNRFAAYSLSLATLGCLILWLGWFGFNGGSTTQLAYVPHILMTTFFSAAAGGIGAVVFSPFITDQKARLTSIINGILGGLVGITAASAYVSASNAVLIGAFSGLIVLWAEKRLIHWRIDDPVGAIPVHLACGGWGTVAVGLFASPASSEYQLQHYSRFLQTGYQLFGWVSVCISVALLSLMAWLGIGILLYALSPKSQKISRAQIKRLGDSDAALAWLPKSCRCVLHLSRQGLRVPLPLEETGGTPTVLP